MVSLMVWSLNRFEDVTGLAVARPGVLQVSLNQDNHVIVYTPLADDVREMMEAYMIEKNNVRWSESKDELKF